MFRVALVICVSVFLSTPAMGQTRIQEVTDLIQEAYGGKKLRSLKSISIESNRRLAYPGTNYSPEFNEFVEDRYHFQIDLENQRGSTERHVKQSGNIYHDRNVTTKNGLAQISYPLNRVIFDTEYDFYNRFGTVFRISDTLLAYVVAKHPERAELMSHSAYRGRGYHEVSLTLPGSDAPLKLGVDAQTGQIMQMTRALGERKITYLYRGHTHSKGVLYARENQVYLDRVLFDYELGRRMTPNRVRASAFKVERELDVYTPAVEDEISVHEITENIHQVGRGINYSTYIQTDGYVIAAGGNDGFRQRYETFKQAHPSAGNLRYLILSHDHELGRSGYEDAVALGATLIVSETQTAKTNEALRDQPSHRVRSVANGEFIGPLQFLEIETAHTQNMMVTYLPTEKLILEEDHYRPLFDGAPGHLYDSTISLVSNVDKLGLDIESLLSGHGSKLESWETLRDVANGQNPRDCWGNRKICRGDW